MGWTTRVEVVPAICSMSRYLAWYSEIDSEIGSEMTGGVGDQLGPDKEHAGRKISFSGFAYRALFHIMNHAKFYS